MTVRNWLKIAQNQLEEAGVGTARLDAIILLEDAMGLDRAKLLAEPSTEIPNEKVDKLKNLLSRRAQHVPLAYVRGKTEFYGREFIVTPAVLEPRPESEALIDELKKLPDLPPEPSIADIGSGSGALGITAALEVKNARVELLETDSKAIKISKINVDKLTSGIEVRQSDLLKASKAAYDVLLCNLPYVPDNFQINTAAAHEPRIALFGGPDGLDLYRRLFEQVSKRPDKPLYILTEALPPQHEVLTEIADHKRYDLVAKNDFICVYKRAQ